MKLVSIQIACLIKELGFDWPTQNRFRKDGGLNQDLQLRWGQPINWNDPCFQDEYRKYTSAPTLDEAADWIRNDLQQELPPIMNTYDKGECIGYHLQRETRGATTIQCYEAYDIAQIAAISQALINYERYKK